MKYIPETKDAIVLRTDFSDDDFGSRFVQRYDSQFENSSDSCCGFVHGAWRDISGYSL